MQHSKCTFLYRDEASTGSQVSGQPVARLHQLIADDAGKSALAACCRSHVAGRHEIELIDGFKQPKRGMADRILMTPTFRKLGPAPAWRITGTPSLTHILLQAFAPGVHAA